jgi:hypothetical protein
MTRHIRAPEGFAKLPFLACVVSIFSICAPPVASGHEEKLDAASAASGERATATTHSSQWSKVCRESVWPLPSPLALEMSAVGRRRVLDARLIGTHKESEDSTGSSPKSYVDIASASRLSCTYILKKLSDNPIAGHPSAHELE